MQILENYPKCILCGSLRLNLLNKQVLFHNFYTKSIKNDLALSEKFLKNENSSVYELLYSSKYTMVFKKEHLSKYSIKYMANIIEIGKM